MHDLAPRALPTSQRHASRSQFARRPFVRRLAASRLLTPRLVALGLLPLTLTACDGGGGGSTGSGPGGDLGGGAFELVKFGSDSGGTLTNGAVWKINRPIELVFNKPVDFSTVDFNSISVYALDGTPALGEFRVKIDDFGEPIPEVIVFQPRCPVEGDLSDAGLLPGGVEYQILVVGKDVDEGLSIAAQNGQLLNVSQARVFSTPTSPVPSDIFFDAVQGGPSPLVQNAAGTMATVSGVEVLSEDGAGGLAPTQLPFQLDAVGMPVVVPDVPINLYSQPEQEVAVVLEFNQPVDPASDNIASDLLQLQFQDVDTGLWVPLPTDVTLVANCTETGAQIRLEPIGILPQDSLYRVVVSNAFRDLIGETNTANLSQFSRFRTTSLTNPGFSDPGALADEVFLPFDVPAGQPGSFEEPLAEFAEPKAIWEGGELRASFDFLGTGGPGGTFDWEVPEGVFLFNTGFASITGGPDFSQQVTQTVLDGFLNVRNFRVPAGSTMRCVGPNPMRIFATGTVEILGTIDVNGIDGPDVVQLNVANIPKSGGPGNCGSGKGGLGSPVTNGSSPQGGQGFGPFDKPGGGGFGGETNYADSGPGQREGAGGGGGQFAVIEPTDTGFNDVSGGEGKAGSSQATSAVTEAGPAQGGAPGPPAFLDPTMENDFWGLRESSPGVFITGELAQPLAGSGGGAGGDSTDSATFPQPAPWNPGDEYAAGGGGSGGGQLQILALGDIVFGENGRLESNGGEGGRGESTNGTNGIGGAGGAGSGGHIILQTSSNVDLTEVSTNALQARGGPGGPASGNQNFTGDGAGGPGSGGVIQIHVPSDENIVTDGTTLAQASDPNAWVCVPTYGRISKARTIYLPLGGARLNPNSELEQVLFDFQGTDVVPEIEDPEEPGEMIPNPEFGEVLTVNNTVVELDPVLTGTILAVDAGERTVTVDASDLKADTGEPFSDDVYLRNTALLRQLELELSQATTTIGFTIEEGGYDAATDELVLRLGGSSDLSGFEAGTATFELIPRFFRVFTQGVADFLPDSASVAFRFQAVGSDIDGNPDVLGDPIVDWTADIRDFNTATGAQAIDFVRMEIEFDLDALDEGLKAENPRPSLDFARFLFKF